MEDYYNTKRLALILSKQAEIEAMKIDNLEREQNNLAPAHDYKSFMNVSNDLQNLAYAHNEQL